MFLKQFVFIVILSFFFLYIQQIMGSEVELGDGNHLKIKPSKYLFSFLLMKCNCVVKMEI
jgi:hypothetical protein